MRLRTGPVRVAVPATSANLGPGFDTLGLALSFGDEVTAEVGGDAISVTVEGEGAGEVPGGADHLIVATLLATLARLGAPHPAGLRLTCRNQIPHARGLGSSSAAIVAGILLAHALVNEPVNEPAALAAAAEIEGHPDNVAPCLLGGVTIAWTGSAGARAVRLEPAPGLELTALVPKEKGATVEARAALPARVPHADAVFNVARAALLVHAVTAEPALLLEATADRLHQDYRAPAMPETADLVARLRARGVPAVVSGAGPTVLAFAPDLSEPGWCARSLSVSRRGARIL